MNTHTATKLFSLALALAPVAHAQQGRTSSSTSIPDSPTAIDARILSLERAGQHAAALAAFEAIPNTGAHFNSGVHAPVYPAVALAYDATAQPLRAYATLETLRNLIVRRVGLLQRSPPAMRATLEALAAAAPRFSSADCRDIAADILARVAHQASSRPD